ncbi:MAG: OadG family protein [Oscillospiraceae bacterium]|nr:OadG family protein [Oscillospiraceae bacterium]MBR2977423.1 OadG family protein [Oscillospiraceae bacterium]
MEPIRLSFAEAGVVALTGYAVVFFGLILLMIVITLLGKVMVASAKKAAPAPAAPAAPAEEPKAVGSCGQVACFSVPDREAAMVMAIAADKIGKPLNELRFISIKEVTKP